MYIQWVCFPPSMSISFSSVLFLFVSASDLDSVLVVLELSNF